MKYTVSEIASQTVVRIGPLIEAGSYFKVLANNGKIPPIKFAIVMIIYIVAEIKIAIDMEIWGINIKILNIFTVNNIALKIKEFRNSVPH